MSHPEFTIEYLDPAALSAHPQNWRRHPEPQRRALQESLSDHGYLAAPIWNRQTGHLLDGHLRVDLAREQGEPRVPVRVIDVPAAQEKRILASFDRIGALALPDDAALASLLQELAASEAGLPAGWEDEDLAGLLSTLGESDGGGLLPDADPDAIPEAVETRCKAGELWALGAHRLLCGDCTQSLDVARLMNGAVADIAITSPPYNLGDDHHTDRERTQSYPDALPEAVYQEKQRALLKESAAIISGDFFYQHKNRIRNGLWISPATWIETGPWRIAQEIVWINGGPNMDPCRFYPQTERIYWLTRRETTTRLENSEHHTDWWQIPPVGAGGEHKQCFPVELPRRLMVAAQAMTIYEPHAGSGTTLIAAEQLGRACYALEISPEFCDVILARWEAATGKSAERLE